MKPHVPIIAIKIIHDQEGHYRKENGCSFEYDFRNGEMALIAWIQVFRDGKLIVEVAEKECILYY